MTVNWLQSGLSFKGLSMSMVLFVLVSRHFGPDSFCWLFLFYFPAKNCSSYPVLACTVSFSWIYYVQYRFFIQYYFPSVVTVRFINRVHLSFSSLRAVPIIYRRLMFHADVFNFSFTDFVPLISVVAIGMVGADAAFWYTPPYSAIASVWASVCNNDC